MRTKKLNLDMESYLNSNELLNFGKSIEESSRLALKKINNKTEPLEESSVTVKSNKKDTKFDPDFIFNAADKAKRLHKIEEAKTFLSTDKYSEEKLKDKFRIDLPYLKSLEEGFKFEDTKITFNRILEEALVIAADLYKETGTTPRLTSLALDKTLTEAESNKIFENKFKNSLEENFRLKLLNGTLLEENAEPIKKIIKVSIDKNLGNDVGEIDPSKLGTVLGFNNVLGDHLKDIILPEGAQNKVNSFINTQDSDYTNIPGNAMDLLSQLNSKIDNLTTLLSGPEFDKNVDIDEDIDAGKYSAIAKVCSMSGNDDKPECQQTVTNGEVDPDDDTDSVGEVDPDDDTDSVVEVDPDDDTDSVVEVDPKKDKSITESDENAQDKDKDGKEDTKEDHGALPKGFKGDHEDAEIDKDIKTDVNTEDQTVKDDIKDAEEVLKDAPKEVKEELDDEAEANLDDEVMDALELKDGEDIAKEDIKIADAEIDPNKPEELEDKELIETSKK